MGFELGGGQDSCIEFLSWVSLFLLVNRCVLRSMGRNMVLVCHWTEIGSDVETKGNVITFAWWCNWSLLKQRGQLVIKASGSLFDNPFIQKITPWKCTIKCEGHLLLWRQSFVVLVLLSSGSYTNVKEQHVSWRWVHVVLYFICFVWGGQYMVTSCMEQCWLVPEVWAVSSNWLLDVQSVFLVPTTILQMIAWKRISCCSDYKRFVATDHVGQEQTFCVVANSVCHQETLCEWL